MVADVIFNFMSVPLKDIMISLEDLTTVESLQISNIGRFDRAKQI